VVEEFATRRSSRPNLPTSQRYANVCTTPAFVILAVDLGEPSSSLRAVGLQPRRAVVVAPTEPYRRRPVCSFRYRCKTTSSVVYFCTALPTSASAAERDKGVSCKDATIVRHQVFLLVRQIQNEQRPTDQRSSVSSRVSKEFILR